MGSNVVANPKKKFPADEKRRHDELMHRHMHNSAYGTVCLAQKAFDKFADLPSATSKAKALALRTRELLKELGDELYAYRVELDGSTKTVKHGQTTEEYQRSHLKAAQNGIAKMDLGRG